MGHGRFVRSEGGGTGSGSCPMAGFGSSGVECSCSPITVLVK